MFPTNLLKQGKGIFRSIHTNAFRKAQFKDGGQHATFNDMPIPQGCWHEANARCQTRYMTILLSGIGALVGSVAFVAQSGLLVLNYTVPDYPYEDEE
uniref:Deltamethrin resistance protein prag01 domain-containing protein n=1 Tax=Stomoxys calcitrans TaxID=35570 RepID=A0A1I8P6K4_STOCA